MSRVRFSRALSHNKRDGLHKTVKAETAWGIEHTKTARVGFKPNRLLNLGLILYVPREAEAPDVWSAHITGCYNQANAHVALDTNPI